MVLNGKEGRKEDVASFFVQLLLLRHVQKQLRKEEERGREGKGRKLLSHHGMRNKLEVVRMRLVGRYDKVASRSLNGMGT